MKHLNNFLIDINDQLCKNIAKELITINNATTPFEIDTVAGKVTVDSFSDVLNGHRVYLDGEMVGTLRVNLNRYVVHKPTSSNNEKEVVDWDRMVSMLAENLIGFRMFQNKALAEKYSIYPVPLDIDLDTMIQTTLLALALCTGEKPPYLKNMKKMLIDTITSKIETTIKTPMKFHDQVEIIKNLEYRLGQLEG